MSANLPRREFALYKIVRLEVGSFMIAVVSFQNVQTFHGASLALSTLSSKRGKPTERLGHKATGLQPEKSGYGSRVAKRAQCLPNAVTSRSQRGAYEIQFQFDPHHIANLRICDVRLAERSGCRPASVKLGR